MISCIYIKHINRAADQVLKKNFHRKHFNIVYKLSFLDKRKK